jgi:spore coat polysaccharide biosynthesis protein SpsF (cytidylyltransferase family)
MKNKKKVTVMIQTRTGSMRLPKKSLALIEKKPMIWHVVNRVKKIKNVEQIALITTRKKIDKILLEIAKKYGIMGYAGDVNDLLNRHYQCAIKIDADPIIRITSDCPLIDPKIVEKVLKFYLDNDYDYVSNIIEPSFPDGLDVEVFSLNALKKAVKNAKLSSEREHMSPYFTKNPNKFKLYNIKNKKNLSHMRWTVDQKQDLTFVRKIYAKMKPKTIFSMKEILKIISEDPELQNINKGIKRNEGYTKSLKNDHKINFKR